MSLSCYNFCMSYISHMTLHAIDADRQRAAQNARDSRDRMRRGLLDAGKAARLAGFEGTIPFRVCAREAGIEPDEVYTESKYVSTYWLPETALRIAEARPVIAARKAEAKQSEREARERAREGARKKRADNLPKADPPCFSWGTKPRRGEFAHNAVLTDAIVREIRRLHSEGHSTRSLSFAFAIARSHCSRIVKRLIWTHI